MYGLIDLKNKNKNKTEKRKSIFDDSDDDDEDDNSKIDAKKRKLPTLSKVKTKQV